MDERVDEYMNFLAVEKGVSRHTLEAYGRDLARMAEFLREQGIRSAECVDQDAILRYCAELRKAGLSANSVNRASRRSAGCFGIFCGKSGLNGIRRPISNWPGSGCASPMP